MLDTFDWKNKYCTHFGNYIYLNLTEKKVG